MKKFKNRLLYYLNEPVLKNLPFFILFTTLLSPHVVLGFLNDVRDHFNSNGFADSFCILIFNLSEVLAFAYLLCLLLYVVKSKFLKCLFYAFALLLCGINIYLRVCFGTLLSSSTLLLIAETNRREAFEFFETFLFSSTGIIVVFVIAIAVAIIYWIETRYKRIAGIIGGKRIRLFVSIGMIVVICIATIETTEYINNFRNQSFTQFENLLSKTQKYSRMDYCRRIINSFFLLQLSGEETKSAIALAEKVKDDIYGETSNDSLAIVLVIGESFIKSHASVYGYPLKTMPNMDEEKTKGNLIAYNNVITTAKHTSMSLRNFFSCNSVGDGERWSESSFFPALFKASGYDVYFWDNQYDPYSQTDLDVALNAYIHHSSISNLSYKICNNAVFEYDGELVEDFRRGCYDDFDKQNRNSLIIFHLMGQHFNSSKRYPHIAEFCRFNVDSICWDAHYLTTAKKEDIAQYDNSIFYNDYVLKEIIELFRSKNSIVIFISDHGELVYDVSDVKGRTLEMTTMTPAEMTHYYSIPMFFWLSEQYMLKHPDMANLIQASKDKHFMSDNICQLLFHIGNIRTKWYQTNRDVLSQDFQCPPRIIENAVDYDEKMAHQYSRK